MQLYDGLPVITNKITSEEQQGIPHHLLGCIGLQEQTWVVGTFVRHALAKITDIRSRGKLPILVGGTHYYIQSVLFRDRLADRAEDTSDREFLPDPASKWPILDQPTDVLLAELTKVDPAMAERWHPNDRRKIQRSLELWLQTGRRASDIYAEQRENRAQRPTSAASADEDLALDAESSMRFPALILWVHAAHQALHQRLDARVDKMLANGLLDEVQLLRSHAEAQRSAGNVVEESKGIWVSIGYKEFNEYAQALEDGGRDEKALHKLRLEAIEKTKASTRQYSKAQIKWIRIKLANALTDAKAMDQLYLLDGTHLASFDADVIQPALGLTEQYLRQQDMPPPASLSPLAAELLTPRRDYDLSATPDRWVKQHCAACNVTCVIEEQWQKHIKSKTHRKLISKANGTKTQRMDPES